MTASNALIRYIQRRTASQSGILKRSPGPTACLLAAGSVDRFAKEVSMAGMTGGFLDEVHQHPAEGEVIPSRSGCTDCWSRLVASDMTCRLRSQASR